jgi:hypothetical protein
MQNIIRKRTGAASYYAPPAVLVGKVCHKVVRAPDFERKDIVQVFAFQPDFIAQTRAQVAGFNQWGFLYNFINLGGEDETQIVRAFGHLEPFEQETEQPAVLNSV